MKLLKNKWCKNGVQYSFRVDNKTQKEIDDFLRIMKNKGEGKIK